MALMHKPAGPPASPEFDYPIQTKQPESASYLKFLAFAILSRMNQIAALSIQQDLPSEQRNLKSIDNLLLVLRLSLRILRHYAVHHHHLYPPSVEPFST